MDSGRSAHPEAADGAGRATGAWPAVLEAAARLPSLADGEEAAARRRGVAVSPVRLPPVLEVPGVVVLALRHGYHGPAGPTDLTEQVDTVTEVDAVWLWADRRTARALGLVVWSLVTGSRRSGHLASVELRLIDPRTDVPVIRVRRRGRPGARPSRLVYRPRRLERYPGRRWDGAASDLPEVAVVGREEPRSGALSAPGGSTRAEAVEWHAGAAGLARLARVLMDAGDPSQPESEVTIESSFGFGGVGSGSAELRLWLPGSINWPAPTREERRRTGW